VEQWRFNVHSLKSLENNFSLHRTFMKLHFPSQQFLAAGKFLVGAFGRERGRERESFEFQMEKFDEF
jgi:hypothetical protein